MDLPGEKVLIRLIDLLETGIGGALRPWQVRRVEGANAEARIYERLLLEQAEKDIPDIRAGRKRIDASGKPIVLKLFGFLNTTIAEETFVPYPEVTLSLADTFLKAANYALIDHPKEAMHWLENAVDRGFINFPFLNEYDPLLNNIRNEPEFKKLMERVKNEWECFEV